MNFEQDKQIKELEKAVTDAINEPNLTRFKINPHFHGLNNPIVFPSTSINFRASSSVLYK
jgi:hypothetical protein